METPAGSGERTHCAPGSGVDPSSGFLAAGSLRVEALAGGAGVSVDTVRYYQARGLLPPPRHQGRVAWYGTVHVERLGRIRALQAKGFSLATIARVLDGSLDAADEALVRAMAEEATATRSDSSSGAPLLSLGELAHRTGIPAPVLQAVADEGLLVPQRRGDSSGYTEDDVEAARSGLALLGWGIPLSELLELATAHHRAATDTARRAVELFDAHVRLRLREEPVDDDEAAAQLVDAFHTLLPAVTHLVAHHFTRVLLASALDHVERSGTGLQRHAVALASEKPVTADGPEMSAPSRASAPGRAQGWSRTGAGAPAASAGSAPEDPSNQRTGR